MVWGGIRNFAGESLIIKFDIMARPPRTNSGTGIYHVMLRGLNKQVIFENSSDFRRFLDLLSQMVHPEDELGHALPSKCTFYAYCLMPNHVHLLIQEKNEQLSTVVKMIATSYAQYFNKKYDRCGHLFQDRFKSEPVADAAYFFTLLRYIHQNPVAGGICESVDGYKWSSWEEFSGKSVRIPPICNVSAVFSRMSKDDLTALVNEPLPKTVRVLDFDRNSYHIDDQEVTDYLTTNYGLGHPSDLQLYDKMRRNDILKAAKDYGASIRQLSRLTGISEGVIRNV